MPAIRAHGLAYQRDLPKAIEHEEKRRPAMAVAIPALTARTHKMLAEAEAARHAGGPDAYSAATRIILADKEASAELKAINDALTARFGARAFTGNSNERDRAAIAALLPPEQRGRLEEITPTFEAIRRFGRAQLAAERRIEVKTMNETGPLLPAVTTHPKTVAEVALEAARASPAYRKHMDEVAALAPVIWRDPAAATTAIEGAMLKPDQRDRLADVIKSTPEQFGALRGSDRLIDRLATAGAERTGQNPRELSADFISTIESRMLEDDAMVNIRMDGGTTVRLWTSSVAVGSFHGFNIRVFGEKGGLRWAQQWPDQLQWTPLNGRTQTIERGMGGLSPDAERATRIATGHSEGMLVAFANIYADLADVLEAHKSGVSANPLAMHFPTATDGLRSIAAIKACVESAHAGGVWTDARPPSLRG